MFGGRVTETFCLRIVEFAVLPMTWVFLQVTCTFVVQSSSSSLYLSQDGRKRLGSSSHQFHIFQWYKRSLGWTYSIFNGDVHSSSRFSAACSFTYVFNVG
jgi:hypothetical protein